jgi:hypothetical protein
MTDIAAPILDRKAGIMRKPDAFWLAIPGIVF